MSKDLEEITNLYLTKKLGWRKDITEDLTKDDHALIHKTLRFQCFLVRYRFKEFAEKAMIPLKNPYFWTACFIVIILASTLND
jgi:hypothetical protein